MLVQKYITMLVIMLACFFLLQRRGWYDDKKLYIITIIEVIASLIPQVNLSRRLGICQKESHKIIYLLVRD